jgi:hypothetical protein
MHFYFLSHKMSKWDASIWYASRMPVLISILSYSWHPLDFMFASKFLQQKKKNFNTIMAVVIICIECLCRHKTKLYLFITDLITSKGWFCFANFYESCRNLGNIYIILENTSGYFINLFIKCIHPQSSYFIKIFYQNP